MRLFRILSIGALAACSLPVFGAQTRASIKEVDVQEIIRRFAAAESENRNARNNYTFTQDVDAVTLGEANSVTGRFKRVSDIVYDDLGRRFERITFFPPPTTTVTFTQEDMQDIAGVQPFALTTEDLSKYNVTFTGKEKIDELNTYVFEVKPRQIVKGERYLEGRIWVEDQDFQIVKVAGQSVPEVDDQKFPHFESYRENIDERYWFPTFVSVDDVLEFKKGPAVHLRMTVRYTNYRRFGGRIRVGDAGEAATDADVKAAEKPKAPAPPAKPPVKPPQN